MIGWVYGVAKDLVAWVGENWILFAVALAILGILVALLPPAHQRR